jgi:hypothetical protein
MTGAEARAALDEVLARGGDVDEMLRAVVETLVARGGCDWAGILFVESGELVLGPEAGEPRPDARAQAPVLYDGDRVAELVADGCGEPALLGHVAERIAPYCLVGWDTGGVPWDPDS